jgi:excisionase family DNA binding protein
MAQVPGLLKADDVAEVLNTSAETVRRWAREGKLSAVVLPSGAIRFRRDDVEALLQPRGAA